MTKTDFVRQYPGVVEGVVVRTHDGEKLGKISEMNEDSFVVQKGLFFPKDFMFRYEDVKGATADGGLIVDQGQADMANWRDGSYSGWSQVEDVNAGRTTADLRPEFEDRYPNWGEESEENARTTREGEEDVRIPVIEEELEAQKTVRQAGEVRLRKIVHSELRHFTVPVMKEEVVVERVPASEDASAQASGDDAFKEQTIAVPIMEEEVKTVKRPIVKEEVRLHKKRTEEQREVSDNVRKEEVQVDEDVPKKRKLS